MRSWPASAARFVRAAAFTGVAVAALVGGGPATAHDSWLAALPGDGPLRLALGTGNRYPRVEVAPPPESIAVAGCRDVAGGAQPLRAEAVETGGRVLRSPARGPTACWVALQPAEIRLAPALVDVYFREARPPADVRDAWAEQLERGIAWDETYRKFARIEVGTQEASAGQLRVLRAPVGLPMEVIVVGEAPLRAGQPARFRVLADGQPMAGFSVELVSERSPLGVWATTDAQGEVAWTLPFAGGWLVRGTWLQRDDATMRWHSRFATLAFDAR